ncbi:E1A 25.1 kDa protein [Human adenovirus 55]|uniref:Early E1A protein n=2 Tax=Human mastadenovirus B TaxID=108098 RepID=C7SRS5_9ADEN|nr:E1A 25.1 kDa protein [Human adenovirus 55]AFQ34451.1 E1A 25 kDa protein [Human mastadenovirus B]QPB74091.1 E1A 25.1 kDa protein [Human adenovirus sp.]AFQ34490.1 E1A 25 kDa protein [Human mastadenovirus B]AFV48136.1 25.7 kDa protein [Human adenovirus 55]
MRHLRFLPQEIISAETGNEILEFVVHALMGDDPEPPVQLFEPPTLQELYDLEVEGSEDSNEEAVNGFFTDSMLLAANEGLELDPPLDTFDTPGVIVESGTGVRKLPDLGSVDCDLHCYEDGFPLSDEEDREKEQFMQTAAGEGVKAASVGFQLDCPELPGHGCPVSDADESPSPDSTTSPPEIQAPVPVDVHKPIPVKLKPGKRPAVEKLEDLLQGGDGPLDLSTRKRPRQ